MKKGLIYIHGKGGTPAEAEHYRPLFAGYDVVGLDYRAQTPWEAKEEFADFFAKFTAKYSTVSIIANSIGAFFAMHAFADAKIEKAFFISPIVDMEKLITDMMRSIGVSEEELRQKEVIKTAWGEDLSWNYLLWVRKHQLVWKIPTYILCGSNDNLQSTDTIRSFADKIGAEVTVMTNGEHWFHTNEQMQFLDNWLGNILSKQTKRTSY